MLVGLIVGCGDGNNTNARSSGSSESSSNAVDVNETKDSIYCNEANVSNLGEPQNSRGYYGDNVCFGTLKIVGKWKRWITYNGEPEVIEFRSDGTTLQYDANGTPDEKLSSIYGVSKDGMTMGYVYHHPSGSNTSDFVFHYLETSQEYPNWIKTTFESFSMDYGITDTTDNYWICRIIYEENLSCN